MYSILFHKSDWGSCPFIGLSTNNNRLYYGTPLCTPFSSSHVSFASYGVFLCWDCELIDGGRINYTNTLTVSELLSKISLWGQWRMRPMMWVRCRDWAEVPDIRLLIPRYSVNDLVTSSLCRWRMTLIALFRTTTYDCSRYRRSLQRHETIKVWSFLNLNNPCEQCFWDKSDEISWLW